ncbi:hypothetical protein Tco_0282107 [Tanacetum coccineum]
MAWISPDLLITKVDQLKTGRGFMWIQLAKLDLENDIAKLPKSPLKLSKRVISNTMAEQNVPAQPPTRTDEQIVPRSQWLIIGKSNILFNAQNCQVDEQWFDLSADLSKGLAITLCPASHPFELPLSGNTVIDFVMRAVVGRVYSRNPNIFLTQGESQSQSKGPKDEVLSPHSLWTFSKELLSFVPKGEDVEVVWNGKFPIP